MIKKIHVKELRKGMFVCALEGRWIDTPFLSHRFAITTQRQIDKLLRCCDYVSIDTDKGLAPVCRTVTQQPRAPVKPSRRPEARAGARQKASEASIRQCSALYDKSHSVLHNVLNDVRLGGSLDTASARRVVEELTTSVIADANAMLYLAQLKDKDRDLAQKAINVCILTLIFGKHIGIPRKKMHVLGLGALLHDIGMVQVPGEILCKPRELDVNERKLVEKHPDFGIGILTRAVNLPAEVLDVVSSHHERIDGQGYPRGLRGREISLFSRMVAISSLYEALTRDRVYKRAISPSSALKHLYGVRGSVLDGRLVEKFILTLGIYPAGCLVETSSGEIGIVTATNESDRLRPVLELLLDASLQPLASRKCLDLSRIDAAGAAIRATLDPGDPRICEFIRPILDEFR